MGKIRPEQRFTLARPCPVCGHWDTDPSGNCHGYTSDRGFVRCSRKGASDGAKRDDKSQPATFVWKQAPNGDCRPWTGGASSTNPPAQLAAAPAPPPPNPPPHAGEGVAERVIRSQPPTVTYSYGKYRVARWDFTNEAGEPDKEVRPQHRVNGTWRNGYPAGYVDRVYRRSDALARPGDSIYIVEGEKCADALNEEGVLAITWPGGAGQKEVALDELRAICAGRDVVLLPDADKVGREAMATVAAALKGHVSSMRLFECYPNVENKRDIYDWLQEGNTAANMQEQIATLPEYIPATDEAQVRRYQTFTPEQLRNLPPIQFTVDFLIPDRSLVGLVGSPGTFKSFTALDLAACIASGRQWHEHPVMQGGVVYVSAEGSAGLSQRLAAWEQAFATPLPPTLQFILDTPQLCSADDVEAVISAARSNPIGVRLVVIDTLARTFNGEENSAQEMGQYIAAADRIRRETGAAVLIIHHTSKAGLTARGSGAFLAALDVEITLTCEARDKCMTMTVTKAKEFAEPEPLTFEAQVQDLPDGTDSIVLEQVEKDAAALTGATLRIGRLLHESFGSEGATTTQWLQEVQTTADIDPRRFYRAKTQLVGGGYLNLPVKVNQRGWYYTVKAEMVPKLGLLAVTAKSVTASNDERARLLAVTDTPTGCVSDSTSEGSMQSPPALPSPTSPFRPSNRLVGDLTDLFGEAASDG